VSVVRFKFRCNILISGKIIKEMPGSVTSGTYCIQYCRVLRKVIRKAKEMYYNELLSSSTNKSKTSWNIVNNEIDTASS